MKVMLMFAVVAMVAVSNGNSQRFNFRVDNKPPFAPGSTVTNPQALQTILAGVSSDADILAKGGKFVADIVRVTDQEVVRSLTKQFGCAIPSYDREATAKFIEDGALFLAGQAQASPNLVNPVQEAGIPIINKSVGK